MPIRYLLLLGFLIGITDVCLGGEPGASNPPRAKQLQVEAAGGLVASQWAVEPLIKNPISVSVDGQGRVFVTESLRRREADLDIRSAGVPIEDELGFRTVEDRRAYYRSGKYRIRFKDRNADGKVDWTDLAIDSERVHRLEDTNDDGVADRATLFSEGFNSEVTGIAAGVLAHEDEVYVTVVPDLWRLRDTDHDGRADERENLATGMGVHLSYAGHDMHGLTVGPDGKLYWTIGDKGIHVTSREGRIFHYPDTGGVMRCNRDGSEFEVFAFGIRNIQEIAFDEFGNLFGVDNDADYPGEKERLVYLVPYGDSGWRTHYQYRKERYNPWIDEHLWELKSDQQPAYHIPPIGYEGDGPSGLSYNPGTALSPRFYRHFFVSHAPGGSLDAFTVEPFGAGFAPGKKTSITRAMTCIGSNFGPDGALYVADWAGEWVLNDKGGVWAIDDPRDAKSPLRKEVQRLLRTGVKTQPVDELAALLGHADQRVRLSAQFALADRKQVAALWTVASNTKASQFARIHAIWGLGMLHHCDEAALLALLSDDDFEIRAQAAQLVGQIKPSQKLSQARIDLLTDSHPRVQLYAALSLHTAPDSAARRPLVALLEANADHDPFLRHGGAVGLASSATADDNSALEDHPSPAVRRAAVVALRRQAAEQVRRFLHDDDESIVAEAARAIHDDETIPNALPALAKLLDRAEIKREASMRRAISANQRLGGADAAERLVRYAATSSIPSGLRVAALQALEDWAKPAPLDLVTGKFVEPQGGTAEHVVSALSQHIELLVKDQDDAVVLASLLLADSYDVATPGGGLAERVANAKLPAEARAVALAALARSRTRSADFIKAARQLLASDTPLLRAQAASLLAAKRQYPEEVLAYLRTAVAQPNSQPEVQSAIRTLAVLQSSDADQLLADWLTRLQSDELPEELRLDVLVAGKQRESAPAIKALLSQYAKAQQDPNDPRLEFRDVLAGGNVKRGQYVFNQHEKAQCVRCHRISEQGSEIGPALTAAGTRLTAEQLAESIYRPQAKIAMGFGTTTLQLSDGRVLSGVIKSEDATSMVILPAEGDPVTITKEDIEAQAAPRSSMPDVAEWLTPDEIRDVIAYLQSLK